MHTSYSFFKVQCLPTSTLLLVSQLLFVRINA
nr:MAG TPA: hypothetical protein [Caudoviricetes sp.]